MAWYEGTTSTYDFPKVLAELMQSTKKEDGSPAWELISKNIGEPTTRDLYTGEGYVLKSTGKDGKANILIRIMPIVQLEKNDSYWGVGAELGVVGTYTPGVNGENGVCTDVMEYKFSYVEDLTLYTNHTPSTMTRLELVQYWISVTEERVIVVAKSRKTTADNGNNTHGICYLGEINSINGHRLRACAGTYASKIQEGFVTNTLGQLALAGFADTNTPRIGTIAISELTCNAQDVHYNDIVDVYPLDYTVGTQVVGNLKDMYYRRFYGNTSSGYVLPTSNFVIIDGEEYLCVMNKYRTNGADSSFSPYSENYFTLIRKV